MRYIITIVFIILFTGCKGQNVPDCTRQMDSLQKVIRGYVHKVDTLDHKLYMANKQIETVKFYIKICQKKPSNKKFFYGWITQRAIK